MLPSGRIAPLTERLPEKMDAKDKFEKILRCPITESELSWVPFDALQILNDKIKNGQCYQANGTPQSVPLSAALKAHHHEIYYPQEQGIYCLLKELAIIVSLEYKIETNETLLTTQEVQRFYENVGWQEQEGLFQDAKDSEDLREVSKEYILQCHLRLNRYLPTQGTYLLDVASGPLQYPAYLSYSEHFEYRVCADISLRALLQAKKKLKMGGFYLLCDITNLPIKDNQIDAVVSLHTLYHVSKEQQLSAFAQLYRVLKPMGTSVVVYSWGGKSLLMNLCLFPFKLSTLLKRKLKSTLYPIQEKSLYFYAHNYAWFKKEIKTQYHAKLFTWRSVNVPFLKTFIHAKWGGKTWLKGLFWLEEKFSPFLGRIGAYPVFVSTKK